MQYKTRNVRLQLFEKCGRTFFLQDDFIHQTCASVPLEDITDGESRRSWVERKARLRKKVGILCIATVYCRS